MQQRTHCGNWQLYLLQVVASPRVRRSRAAAALAPPHRQSVTHSFSSALSSARLVKRLLFEALRSTLVLQHRRKESLSRLYAQSPAGLPKKMNGVGPTTWYQSDRHTRSRCVTQPCVALHAVRFPAGPTDSHRHVGHRHTGSKAINLAGPTIADPCSYLKPAHNPGCNPEHTCLWPMVHMTTQQTPTAVSVPCTCGVQLQTQWTHAMYWPCANASLWPTGPHEDNTKDKPSLAGWMQHNPTKQLPTHNSGEC